MTRKARIVLTSAAQLSTDAMSIGQPV